LVLFPPLNTVSPVLCLESELRPLVHFDGELLMVIFVVLSAMMYLFGGQDAEIVMRAGHIIGLQGKHAVHGWRHRVFEKGPEEQRRPVDSRHPHGERCFAR